MRRRRCVWAPSVRVLFVTSEFCGYLKAGGLGEVSAALPRALNGLCDIRVLMPAYPAVRKLHDDIEIIKEMPAVAGLPAWSLGPRGDAGRADAVFRHLRRAL